MRARNLIHLLTFAIAIFASVQFGCSSAPPAATSQPKSNAQYGYTTLLDMLRKEPQLTISGSGNNPTIRIRGDKSIHSNNEPLFVVNGTPLGQGYNSVSSLDVNSVESIRVLPASRAGIYGARGATGVIEIKMK